jgi:hypothetical protein
MADHQPAARTDLQRLDEFVILATQPVVNFLVRHDPYPAAILRASRFDTADSSQFLYGAAIRRRISIACFLLFAHLTSRFLNGLTTPHNAAPPNSFWYKYAITSSF